MSVRNFWIYFKDCKENLKSFNFTDDKLCSLSSELALRLVEADLKEKESALAREKLQREMEALVLQNKVQRKQLELEALKALVQAESMVRSVGDNAVINRANAYVGFLNVVGNASESSAIASHSNGVITEIKKISDTALTGSYAPILANWRNDFENSLNKQGNMRECSIIAPRTELKVREPMELVGFSVYPNNECYWTSKGEIYKNTQIFRWQSHLSRLLCHFILCNDK
ncbi:MAG: hypothetical protein J1E31_03880 [Helicobacter sp.]|nr:hypothetical protein [Helicobacter sp.]